LVRRDKGKCKAPYICIAAARPIDELVLREAAKYQEDWQRETKVIGARAKEKLLMFIQHLLDNNEPQFFYLHEESSLGIHQPCCAVLSLSVALRAEHYDTLLEAKIAQITDTFQAKLGWLGWLVGSMYSWVGTTEWDHEYPLNPCRKHAEEQLGKTLVQINDEQIKEGLGLLRERGELERFNSEQILEFIQDTTVKSRSKKVQERAVDVVKDPKRIKFIGRIKGQVGYMVREGGELKGKIANLLKESKVEEPDALADIIMRLFDERLTRVMTEETFPTREALLTGIINSVLQDAKVKAILG
jgi:hypothetical protein